MIFNENRQVNIKARKNNESLIQIAPENFGHHFYRFDYKITSDLTQIPMLTWVNDEADYQGFGEQLKLLNEKFYLESLKYEGLKFDGDYNYKSKRIARIMRFDFEAFGKPDFRLSLKLLKPDKCMDVVDTMSNSIREVFSKDNCYHCNAQDKDGNCKLRLNWTYDGVLHEGCSCLCFNFNNFDDILVTHYWRMLELQYGLKKIAV